MAVHANNGAHEVDNVVGCKRLVLVRLADVFVEGREEEVEKVISKILNKPTKIYGSGRTDAGVHAHGQTFHFDADIKDLGKFKYSLNSLLPDDIFVKNIESVGITFHARYLVKEKTYIYYINTGEYNPFERNTVYQLLRPLNIIKMRSVLNLFKGRHDFRNFTSKTEDENQFVRTIKEASIKKDGDIVSITFVGDGFMRYMVRMIVGSLIEVGLDRLEISKLSEMFLLKERKVVSFKAPSCGLYLKEVLY